MGIKLFIGEFILNSIIAGIFFTIPTYIVSKTKDPVKVYKRSIFIMFSLIFTSFTATLFKFWSGNSILIPSALNSIDPKYNNLIFYFWIVGTSISIIKNGVGYIFLRFSIMRNLFNVTDRVYKNFSKLKIKANIKKDIKIFLSDRVVSPLTIGFLKPIILIPISLVTKIDSDQIEGLIAHELAHIKRNDYLINIFQILAESILFYHPLVYILNTLVRESREMICDDIAVNMVEDKKNYMKAIGNLALERDYILAISANGGSIISRLERLKSCNNLIIKVRGFKTASLIMILGLFLSFNFLDLTKLEKDRSDNISRNHLDSRSFIIPVDSRKAKSTESTENKNFIFVMGKKSFEKRIKIDESEYGKYSKVKISYTYSIIKKDIPEIIIEI